MPEKKAVAEPLEDLASGKREDSLRMIFTWPSRFIVNFPIEHGGSFHSFLYVYHFGYTLQLWKNATGSVRWHFGPLSEPEWLETDAGILEQKKNMVRQCKLNR